MLDFPHILVGPNMSNVDPDTATTYANLDWEHYMQSRPSYPQSLKSLIYDYRRAHSKSRWERVVDVGGGIGISSTIFAPDFSIVHLLDPSPLNHEKARIFLGEWVARHGLHTRLEYTLSTAEEGNRHVKEDADLVVCAEVAHFVDPDSLVASAAGMLRFGGTLAVYTYWVPVFPDQSKRFSEIFCRALTRTLGLCIRPGDQVTSSLLSKAAARVSSGSGYLDSVPMPDEYFEDIRRVRINPDSENVMDTFRRSFPVPFEPVPSRARDGEKEFRYYSGQDPQAEGWCFEVDSKWLHNFMATMRPAEVELSDELYESIYGEWDRVFAKECPSGSTRALWPVNLILATRR